MKAGGGYVNLYNDSDSLSGIKTAAVAYSPGWVTTWRAMMTGAATNVSKQTPWISHKLQFYFQADKLKASCLGEGSSGKYQYLAFVQQM